MPKPACTSIRTLLSELSGMPESEIYDTMTIRHDLGIGPVELNACLSEHFKNVQTWKLFDPAALVHDIENAVS
jgi:hypothetical protein